MPEIRSYICIRSTLSLPVLFTPGSQVPPPSASVGSLPCPPLPGRKALLPPELCPVSGCTLLFTYLGVRGPQFSRE